MRYTKEQIVAALVLFNATGSPNTVIKTLGYPSTQMLYKWREKYPQYFSRPSVRHYKQASAELKEQVIKRCLIDGESVKSVSGSIGYSVSIVYKWLREYDKKGFISVMKKKNTTKSSDIDRAESIEDLRAQLLDMQMEIDILKETINVLKKDPGVDLATLKNKEKAVIIGAMRNKYSLPKLCNKLSISRSSYYYQATVLKAEDKYKELRIHIIKLFRDHRSVYGYRRIHALLKKEGHIVSEKVVRQIMKQEGLTVKIAKKRKYNSYQGEISTAPENIINRDFHAESPNKKWLTDITEFAIKAGKVYLSPILDCFDGMPVSWTIGCSPNADLANTMLKKAISTLAPKEKPIIHSDRGCHYRWGEWIKLPKRPG